MTINVDGTAFRQWFIRLPEGMVADDLKVPAIWSTVQHNRSTALRKHDRLVLVAFDESWSCDAVVTAADNREATIAMQRIVSFEPRQRALYSDDQFAVEWVGYGFTVVRRSDHQRMSNVFHTEGEARQALANLYPSIV